MDGTTHFNAAHNAVQISVPKPNTDSGHLNPIHIGYVNESTVNQQIECEEIHHITNNPTYVNSNMDATAPGVDAITPVQPSEQHNSGYERAQHTNGTHNLSGWFQQHKILSVVVLAGLVTMAIAAGVATTAGVVSIMMVVTKENTAVVKDISEPSPATTLLVTKEDNIKNDTKVGIGNDITTGTMTPVTSHPVETTLNAASLVVIGGLEWKRVKKRWESINTVDIYRLHSGRIEWSHQGESCPFTGYKFGRAVDGRSVYVLGGVHGRFSPEYGVARYNVDGNTWQQLPNTTRDTSNGPAAFIHGEMLYLGYMTDMWTLDLSQVSAGTWTKQDIKLPHRIEGADTVVTVGERVFLIGEWTTGYSVTSVRSWRPGTNEPWRSVSDMNVARVSYDLCSVTDGVDRIWVMGGSRRSLTGFIEMYRVSTDTWTQLDALPENMSSNTILPTAEICGYHDGYIYAIVGTDGYNVDRRFHIFNTMENTWSVSDTQLRTYAQIQAAVVVT